MKVRAVFRFPNGMVAVTDEHGNQIPELQGKFEDVKEKVETAADEGTEWNGWNIKEWGFDVEELQRLRRFRHELFMIDCWENSKELSKRVMAVMDALETEELELENDDVEGNGL